jgi:hypothetical protein
MHEATNFDGGHVLKEAVGVEDDALQVPLRRCVHSQLAVLVRRQQSTAIRTAVARWNNATCQ